jgi:hypothetical protein
LRLAPCGRRGRGPGSVALQRPAPDTKKRGDEVAEEKKDETIYDRIRREARERQEKELAEQDRRERFLHRRPSPEMEEMRRRFNR